MEKAATGGPVHIGVSQQGLSSLNGLEGYEQNTQNRTEQREEEKEQPNSVHVTRPAPLPTYCSLDWEFLKLVRAAQETSSFG